MNTKNFLLCARDVIQYTTHGLNVKAVVSIPNTTHPNHRTQYPTHHSNGVAERLKQID